jgi:hypothetical protein
MNNILGVSYPIDENVKSQLRQLPELAKRISLSEPYRSKLEIVRVLGNAHYERIRKLLEFLEQSGSTMGWLVDEVLIRLIPCNFAEGFLSCIWPAISQIACLMA